MTTSTEQPTLKDRLARVLSDRQRVITIAVIVILVILSIPFIPTGIDYYDVLRPATIAFLRFENPYHTVGTLNPPWIFLLLAPIAILPVQIGGAILFWLNLFTWIIVTWKLSNNKLASIIAVVTSPMVFNGLMAGNVDFLVMWGLLLPAEFAVFFLAIKPQVGGAAILYLAIHAYKEGGWQRLARLFLLPLLITVLSFVVYGLWPLNAGKILGFSWNASPLKILGWPSIVIGLLLFILALSRKNHEDGTGISMAASPFFSPYVGSQSWVAILPALMKTKVLYIVWVILWGWIAYLTFK